MTSLLYLVIPFKPIKPILRQSYLLLSPPSNAFLSIPCINTHPAPPRANAGHPKERKLDVLLSGDLLCSIQLAETLVSIGSQHQEEQGSTLGMRPWHFAGQQHLSGCHQPRKSHLQSQTTLPAPAFLILCSQEVPASFRTSPPLWQPRAHLCHKDSWSHLGPQASAPPRTPQHICSRKEKKKKKKTTIYLTPDFTANTCISSKWSDSMNSHLKRHSKGSAKETTAIPHRIFLSLQTYTASQILVSAQN